MATENMELLKSFVAKAVRIAMQSPEEYTAEWNAEHPQFTIKTSGQAYAAQNGALCGWVMQIKRIVDEL